MNETIAAILTIISAALSLYLMQKKKQAKTQRRDQIEDYQKAVTDGDEKSVQSDWTRWRNSGRGADD